MAKENILDTIRRQKQYAILGRDKKVQKMWKDYQKKTKGLQRLSKNKFYDVYIRDNKVEGKGRAGNLHLEA